jgi:hypothetical protein
MPKPAIGRRRHVSRPSARRMRLLAGSLLAGWMIAGCARSMPPEVPDFKPPAKAVVKEETPPQVVADTRPAAPVEPPPAPAPAKPAPAAPRPEAPPPPVEKKVAPTLVGTWKISEMSVNGQSPPESAQMQMTMTFEEGGSVTMTVSAPQMPQAHTQTGTWSLIDGQITMSMDRESRTGRCTFEGDSRAILEFEEGGQKIRMVLTKTS